jgi:hypothetical protein
MLAKIEKRKRIISMAETQPGLFPAFFLTDNLKALILAS